MKNYNKIKIADSFSKAASTYDRFASIQYSVGQLLLNFLDEKDNHKNILDVGSGTGAVTRLLKNKFQNSEIIAIDLAYGMLDFGRSKNIFPVCSDADNLPIKSKSIELVFSNMMLQWSANLSETLKELKRTLKTKGTFVFSTLGTETLQEIRRSWKNIDTYSHVNNFISKTQLAECLNKYFSYVDLYSQNYSLHFETVREVVRYLKNIGVNYVNNACHVGMTGKGKFKMFTAEYEKMRDKNGYLPMTYEVFYGICQK